MKTAYQYVYYKIYRLVQRTPSKKDAAENSMWLLTVFISFNLYTMLMLTIDFKAIDHYMDSKNFAVGLGIVIAMFNYVIFLRGKKYEKL